MAEQKTDPGPGEIPPSAKPSYNGGAARPIRLLFLAIAIVLVLLLLWQALPVLLLLFAATLIALALRFLSDSLSRFTRVPPLWSLTVVLLLIVAGSGVGLAFAVPALWEQFSGLTEGLESSIKHLEEALRDTEWGKWLLEQLSRAENLKDDVASVWPRIAGFFGTTFGAIAAFFLTLVVGIFLAYSPELYISGFLRLIPKDKRGRTSQIVSELGHTLRWWIVGQLISMLFLFVTTWLMLRLLGVPLAFALGLLTGLLTFIPYLGPLIALIPILLIAFVESPTLALWVLGLYLVIQNLESNVLMPIIFSKTAHLPPVLTLIAQVLLGGMFGFIGILLATPLMAAAMVLVRMVYVEDVIGDDLNSPVVEMAK